MASPKGSDARPRINEAAQAEVLGRGTRDVPTTRACLSLVKRLESHGGSYFRFITTPGIKPTNSPAEQAIRFVVTHRRIMLRTRNERGDRWCERLRRGDPARRAEGEKTVAGMADALSLANEPVRAEPNMQ